MLLNLRYDGPVSNFALNFNLRRFTQDWGRVKAVVDTCVAQDTERLKWAEGRKVFEVKPRVAWDKGKALSYLLNELGRVVQADPIKPTLKEPGTKRVETET